MTTSNDNMFFRESGKKCTFQNRQDHVLKEEIFFKCYNTTTPTTTTTTTTTNNNDILCDVKITTYKNTVENYHHKGQDLRKLKVENKYKLTPSDMNKRYGINVLEEPSLNKIMNRIPSALNEWYSNGEQLIRNLFTSSSSSSDNPNNSVSTPTRQRYSQFEEKFDRVMKTKNTENKDPQ
jgi:hypothetical protein